MSAEVVPPTAGHPSFRQDIFHNAISGTEEDGSTGDARKLGALQRASDQIASRVRPQLDAPAKEVFDSVRSTVEVFDGIAEERLRFMPENGSQLDRASKQAVVLVGRLEQLARLMSSFTSGTERAIRLMGGSFLLLLQCGSEQPKLLASLFQIFHRLAVELSHVRNNLELLMSDNVAQQELVAAYAELCGLICSASVHYFQKAHGSSKALDTSDLQFRFKPQIQAFHSHRIAVKERLWSRLIMSDVSVDPSEKVQEIWEYLSVKDRVASRVLSARSPQPAEYTCEWFSNRLSQIRSSESQLFTVTGDTGTGKTVLSEWIVQQLQTSMDPHDYDVVTFRVYDDISATTGPIGLAKGLLLEILGRQAKDGDLLRALERSMHLHSSGASSKSVEDSLWQAINIAVRETGKMMVILDGIDSLNGDPEVIPRLFDHLKTLVSQSPAIKVITLFRPLNGVPSDAYRIKIEPNQTASDVRTVVRNEIECSEVCIGLTLGDREEIETGIVKKANGCFPLAQLAVGQLNALRTSSDMIALVQRIPSLLQDMLKQTLDSIDLSDWTARSVLAWMIVSHRPLRVEEIRSLLEIDTKRTEVVPRVGNAEGDIRRMLGSFITIEDEVISFRSSALRQYIINQAKSAAGDSDKGKLPLTMKEAHSDLLTRLLAYVKLNVTDEVEVSTTPLSESVQRKYFDQYQLLEYAARYWTLHFRSSQMNEKERDNFMVTNLVKRSFPDSVLLALLEGGCHQLQYLPYQVQELQVFSVQLRRQLFPDLSLSLLQSLISAAQVSQRLGSADTADYSYEAWRKSISLLGSRNIVTRFSAEIFIDVVAQRDSRDKAFLDHKEEVLEYLLQATKEEVGFSNDVAIKYTQMLLDHQVTLKHKESVRRLSKELFEMGITRYGQHSREMEETTEHIYRQLERLSMPDVTAEILQTEHEFSRQSLAVTDQRMIDSTLQMVKVYEEGGETSKADALFMDTWRKLLAVEDTSDTVIKQQAEFTIRYAEYLERHSRKEEAESVTSAAWFCLEAQASRFDQLSSTFELVLGHIRKMKWDALAQSAMGTLWKSCKSQKQVSHRLVQVTASLAQTVQQSSSTASSGEASMSQEQIEIIHEILESARSVGMHSSDTALASMKAAKQVASPLMESERYVEAASIYCRALSHLWAEIDSKSTTIRLSDNVDETVELATSLAECYFKDLQIEKAALVYQNILEAVLSSDATDTQMVRFTADKVITFYQTIYRFLDAIKTYGRLYRNISSRLGKAHKQSIEILYECGDLAKRCHLKKEAEQAYQEIYNNLGHNSQLDHRAIAAARALATIYEETERWTNARGVYETLWRTISTSDKDHVVDSELVEEVYQHYMTLLETKLDANVVEIHDLAASYRKICQRRHGSSSRQVYEATLSLAESSRRDERYHDEAVELYEAALEQSETFAGRQEITTMAMKRCLADLYARQSRTTHKAAALYRERFTSSVHEHGYASQEYSLPQLRELLQLLHRQNSKVAHQDLQETLGTSTVAAFEEKTDSQHLYTAAVELAQMAASFVVAFEMSLRNSHNYASMMADLIAEIQLYSTFHHARKQKGFIHTFIAGIRLMNFQSLNGWTENANTTDAELFQLFTERFTGVETGKTVLREFYDICISQAPQGSLVRRLTRVIVDNVYQKLATSRFRQAYSHATILHEFVKDSGGFQDQDSTRDGVKLSEHLLVQGSRKCPDRELGGKMLVLSKTILHEIVSSYHEKGVNLTDFETTDLNQLAILLGGQRNFEDLEFLLSELWSSRVVQKTWSSDTIILVGRRLVEARFSNGRTMQATQLCGDLCYNVKRVWGQFDRSALELTNLLSALYTTEGDHVRAMGVHESVLRQLLEDSTDITLSEAAEIASKQTALIQRCYQRNGGWSKGSDRYENMFNRLNEKFAKEKKWARRNPQHWTVKEVDKLGVWEAPHDYGFLMAGKGATHQNQLRKASEPDIESSSNTYQSGRAQQVS
ncbi:hypothetical protein ANOM_002969 [Aspergillus nomiae NRRL 13137]|uniref:Nephrocystin 3-like N-terminal domain-containing protein n=1 Tax=Aspergillus nomiae NRRL (strain ATCC 15546 / NRRL 13137 / CBS 260.88 / M93) TaxID=1509407 RepID=A0A0L1JBM4_ASPN3|nr:uncharacterized protein ANOM_002969 [Aspergillus nomiae NRRL 13137]KNG89117.1 hypothetical protein ANOM_002969 [Aspergillus nomiae NRRL 13137]